MHDERVTQIDAAGRHSSGTDDGPESSLSDAPARPVEVTPELLKRRLTALVEVSNDLSKAHTMDDLCRLAVRHGRERLGFDRMGIWLISEEQDAYLGTFGTDEHGGIRDERGERHPLDVRALEAIANPTPSASIHKNCGLTGKARDVVGEGHHASSALVDEGKVFGFVDIDNLLTHRPISEDDCEVLGLFASTLAQSCRRVRAEEALRRNNAADQAFKDRLTRLLKVSNVLSKIEDLDYLCRRAIELGRSELGFERLGMWFFSEDRKYIIGSYGTDEHGQIRDERQIRIPCDAEAREQIARQKPTEAIVSNNHRMTDSHGREVGKGPHAYATIWDGETVSGWLFLDRYLTRAPIDEHECEVLVLYASVLGHLCSRIWAEEAHLRQVRKLSADAEKSLEQERARISKELHDELGQILTAFNMNLAWVAGKVVDAPTELRERIRECQANVNHVVQTVRDLSRSLRPQLIDHHGLLDVIRAHVSEFEQGAGIACRVRAVPSELEVSDPPATAIFRIIQEALTNVARHSGATECEIALEQRGSELRVSIGDNGVGAPAHQLSGEKSLGIIGMKERAAALHGKLSVNSAPEGGVCVVAEIPVQHETRGTA